MDARGSQGNPSFPMEGQGVGTACPSRLLQKVSERSHQPAYDGGKQALFSQLRGQREGGKPPDLQEGLATTSGLD